MTALARFTLRQCVRLLDWVADERSPIVDETERLEVREALHHIHSALGPNGTWTVGPGGLSN